MEKSVFQGRSRTDQLTKNHKDILTRMHSLRTNLDDLMETMIMHTKNSNLESVIETHKVLLDTMNKEIHQLIVECVGEFS